MVPQDNQHDLCGRYVAQVPSSDLLIRFAVKVLMSRVRSHLPQTSAEVYTARHSLGTGSGSPIDLEGSWRVLYGAGRFFLAACQAETAPLFF